MNISYFRTSTSDREQTAARLREATEAKGLTIMGEVALPDGKGTIFNVCRPEWAATVIEADPNLMGLLPCTITVVERGEETVVGAGTPTLLGRAAPSQAVFDMAQEAEELLRAVVEAAADVDPPKAKMLTLYSTHTCPYCNMEKAWLEKNEVPHEVIFVDENQEAAVELVRTTGQQGVPQTRVEFDDGSFEYFVGFDKQALERVAASMKAG